MATARSTIFRASGLPIGPEDEIISSLITSLHQHASDAELERLGQIATVPSCYDEETSVVLLEWKGSCPGFLSTLDTDPLSSWEMELGDHDISFDRHFLGFTQLYSTVSGQSINADIIAVTGLDGHAYGSFRGKGTLRRMWLRDFLSKDLPQCRTMIYGYNSKLSSRGVNRIADYGRGFLEAVKMVRRDKEARQRPLFFIAHSFGGIIVAHSLIRSAMKNEDDNETMASFYKATYGVLFFGTPHKGLIVADIHKMIAGDEQHPRRALLEEIDENSSVLLSQLADFKDVIRDRKIISFYEQSQTPALAKHPENQTWSRSGNYATAVEPDSAILQLPDFMETKIPLDLDHSHIVKFDNKRSEGYTSALHYLTEFEKDAPRVVAARFLQKQAETRAVSTVPFKRDSNFVGREDILARLDTKLSSFKTHTRIALVGLGGMGKSQIAIEYSYRLRKKLLQIWIFWVYAGTEARFEQSYRAIADALELPERENPKVDIFQLVSRWLADETNGPWLLIIDNADDANMFSSGTTSSITAKNIESLKPVLLAHIPQASTGSVLITSRNTTSAYKLTGDHKDIISIGSMDEKEALTLLVRKLPDLQPLSDCHELLLALDHMPLAITQAAAYISNGAPRMNPSKYLSLFNESESNRSSLLQEDLGDLRRDPEVPNAVIKTWQISFNQIRRDKPDAADLLALMSVLHRQGIPEYIMVRELGSQMSFEAALAPLLAFSLIIAESGHDLYDMHRLVQLATKKWLEVHDGIAKWKKSSLKLLSEVFPHGAFKNWSSCGLLLPHIEEVLSYDLQAEDDLLHKASIQHNLAWYFWTKGDYQMSMSKIRQALDIRNSYLDEKNESRLATLGLFATVLKSQGEYKEAETLHREEFRLIKEVLGEKHPETLTSMNNLALVIGMQGKYNEAEALHREELELTKEVLGEKHPDTLMSMSNLALVFHDQGKYDEAEAMNRQTLMLRKEVLDKKHPDTLTSMSNLALVLHGQGKYDEAEAMNRQTLMVEKEVLGEKHPDTLMSMSNLALVFHDQGKYDEAEAMNRQTLMLRKEVLDKKHPDTLTSMSNLAFVLHDQGKYDEAEAMNRQTLMLRKEVLGEKHPDTLMSMNNFALVLDKQWKYDEAEAMHRQTLKLREEVLGEKHPDTLLCAHCLAYLLQHMKQYEEASILYRRACAGFEKALGSNHPKTKACLNDYNTMLAEIGNEN